MIEFLSQTLHGLTLGALFALVAIGYTMVFGIIKLINFAHGDIYMVGAFVGYYALRFFIRWLNFTEGVSLIVCFALSVIVSAIACAALAMIIERLAYRPLRKSTRIAALITAVGVSFLLENLGIIVFGANPKSYEPKTLAVYQLVLVGAGNVESLENAQDEGGPTKPSVELKDVTQFSFPKGDLGGLVCARVRLVSRQGNSEWSPWINIYPDKPSDYFEVPERARSPLMVIPSIGYTTRTEKGQKLTTISWAQGPSDLTSLNPVFSDANGKALAFELPINTAAGTPVRLPYINVVILTVTSLTLLGLNLLINRTMFGISMRALSLDINAAKLMGVNTDAVIAWTFAIGGAAAALAGNMVGMYNQTIEPLMGVLPGLKAFVAAVVGGIGSIPGAAVGGIIMGVSEALVKATMPARYSSLSDALAFAILIVVLLFKPSGIFGRTLKEKV
ncbi:MAG: branched-chain amino acid ABC transporter permease [bacterium]|nr:branched-chain amino acid ABC transporter permease [bacterium]